MEAKSPTSSFATVTPSIWEKYHGGDQATWEKVFKKYCENLQRFLCSYWRSKTKDAVDDQVICDVIQDAMLKVRKSQTFTIQFQGGGFRRYLREAAINMLRDRWKSQNSEKKVLTFTPDYGENLKVVTRHCQTSMPDIEQKELIILIRQCAQRLQDAGKISQEHLNIFFEACKGNLSPTEIACLYGTSSANVNQIKCRVSQMIRERLGAASE